MKKLIVVSVLSLMFSFSAVAAPQVFTGKAAYMSTQSTFSALEEKGVMLDAIEAALLNCRSQGIRDCAPLSWKITKCNVYDAAYNRPGYEPKVCIGEAVVSGG